MSSTFYIWLVLLGLTAPIISVGIDGAYNGGENMSVLFQFQALKMTPIPGIGISIPWINPQFWIVFWDLLTWDYPMFTGWGLIVRFLFMALTANATKWMIETVSPIMLQATSVLIQGFRSLIRLLPLPF